MTLHMPFSLLTDLVAEAFLCGEVSTVCNHSFTGEDGVSHNLDDWCYLWRRLQCKGHLALSHWNSKLSVMIQCINQHNTHRRQITSTGIHVKNSPCPSPPSVILSLFIMTQNWNESGPNKSDSVATGCLLKSWFKQSLSTMIILHVHLFKSLRDNGSSG